MFLTTLIALALIAGSPVIALCDNAESLYGQGKLDEAFQAAGEAEQQAIAVRDTSSLIKAYCIQADIAVDRGDDLAAVDFYNKCAVIQSIATDTVPLPDINLSSREKEVLLYCCQGLISKEIAQKMNVSVRTVESHKFNLFRKLGVNTTNELIAFAFKTGINK